MPIPSEAYRASAAPYSAESTLRLLEVTQADAEIALVSGTYEVQLTGSTLCMIALGVSTAAVAALAPGDPETHGIPLLPGQVVTIFHDATRGDGKLHAVLRSAGTETLVMTRKAGA